jgi:hypothetical protein
MILYAGLSDYEYYEYNIFTLLLAFFAPGLFDPETVVTSRPGKEAAIRTL